MLLWVKISRGAWAVEAGGSWTQGHPQLQSKFKANLNDGRHCLKNKQNPKTTFNDSFTIKITMKSLI